MARHARGGVPWFRVRTSYKLLWDRYQDLLREYRALKADHDRLLAETAVEPEPGQTSWGLENQRLMEPPVITSMGLDPDKTDSLVRRAGLLDDPSGEWSLADIDRG